VAKKSQHKLDQHRPFCLKLHIVVAEELEAEGWQSRSPQGRLDEHLRRVQEVYVGARPCPAAGTCQYLAESRARSHTPVWEAPRQLELPGMGQQRGPARGRRRRRRC